MHIPLIVILNSILNNSVLIWPYILLLIELKQENFHTEGSWHSLGINCNYFWEQQKSDVITPETEEEEKAMKGRFV